MSPRNPGAGNITAALGAPFDAHAFDLARLPAELDAAASLNDIALSYALNRGWAVFPVHGVTDSGACTCGTPDCGNAGKHPTTGNGLKAATKDARGVALMFRPGFNIAVATGEVSGFWVLDIDGQAGEQSLASIEAERGALPATRVHFTGNGRHLLFNWPGVPIKNSVKKLSDGLDVRGDGGYIVAAPSRHVSGVEYRFADIDAPIADAPAWLVDMVRKDAPVGTTMPAPAHHEYADRHLTADQVREMLSYVSADLSYDDWVHIGMGLHAGGYPVQLWDDWSREGAKYQTGDCWKRWKGFKPGHGVTMGTVWHHAQAAGWSPEFIEHDRPNGPHPAERFLARVRAKPAGEARSRPRIAATPFEWVQSAHIPRREWIYGDHLLRQFVSLTVAPGATGKSSLVVADAIAMASGRAILDVPVYGGPKRVWLWNLEDPIDEMHRRVAATCQHHHLGAADLADRLFLDSGRVQELCIARQDRNGIHVVEPIVDELADEIKARRIDVLMLDPFVSSHAVSENDNGAIDAVVKAWGRVADRANCAIELVHHLRKLGANEGNAETARGASSLVAAARSVRVLNRMSQEEADRAGIQSPHGYFRVYDDKNNLSPPAAGSDWYHLAPVTLANNDSVGVVESWIWPDPFSGVTTADLLEVQTEINGKGFRENVQASEWVGHAVGRILEIDSKDRSQRARIKSLIKDWIKSGALVVTDGKDDKGNRRPVIEVGTWATA